MPSKFQTGGDSPELLLIFILWHIITTVCYCCYEPLGNKTGSCAVVNLIVHNFIKHGSQCTRHGQEASVLAKGRLWCGQELCPAPPHPPCRARLCCSHGSCFAPARVHRKEPKCHRANISCTQGAAPRSAGEQRLLTDIALRKAAQGKENERKTTFSIKILWQR